MMVTMNRRFFNRDFPSNILDNQNPNNGLLLPFLEAAQNQMIPPPPSPRELFPALPPFASSGTLADTSYTD